MINFTISIFLENQLNVTLSLPFCVISYVYYTQIMQAETLASAYRLWRRNWKGRGREYTAGALVWQVRDFFIYTPMPQALPVPDSSRFISENAPNSLQSFSIT